MAGSSLYDDDILLWSEQQAAVIRQLARTQRGLPNELDIENVAEEIESVGRSELASVQSHLRLLFIHLIKLVLEPDVDAASHWRSEIVGFHADMRQRYAPSMRQRIDLDALWRLAREQIRLGSGKDDLERVRALPARSVFMLDDLVVEQMDVHALERRLRERLATA